MAGSFGRHFGDGLGDLLFTLRGEDHVDPFRLLEELLDVLGTRRGGTGLAGPREDLDDLPVLRSSR